MRGVPASRAISRTLAARAFALVALWPLVPLLSACPKIERLTVDGGPLDGGKADARVYAPSDAGDDAEAGPPAAPPVVVPPIDLVPPPNDADLAARAKHLLEAITQDNADLARDILLPRDAYLKNRDVKDPGKTWELKVYNPFQKAVHRAHKSHPGLGRAIFVSVELGHDASTVSARPKEWKYEVWRVTRSRIVYSLDGSVLHLELGELTSFRGAWYVTHLR